MPFMSYTMKKTLHTDIYLNYVTIPLNRLGDFMFFFK